MSTKISKPELRKYLRSKYGSNWWFNKTKDEKAELFKIATFHLTFPEEQIPSNTCDEETVLPPVSCDAVSYNTTYDTKNIYEDDGELTNLRVELSRLKKEAYIQDEKLKLRIEIDSLRSRLGENPNILNL